MIAAQQLTLAEFDKTCRTCVSFHEGTLLTCCAYWPQVECKDISIDDVLFFISENGCEAHQRDCLTLAKGFNPSSVCSCSIGAASGPPPHSRRQGEEEDNKGRW